MILLRVILAVSKRGDKKMNSRLRYDITNSTFWDDAKFPVTGDRIDTSSGRLDYDHHFLTDSPGSVREFVK